MNEIEYSAAELSRLKYVKVTYTGLDNKAHEIKTDVKLLGQQIISLYFKYKDCFDIQYPQNINIKFVTDTEMFLAKSILREIKTIDSIVYMTVVPPLKMVRRQERKYYRVNMKRACVLFASDEDGRGTGYISRLVDISVGGVLIHKLESMFNDDYVELDTEQYKYFNIVLFLDIDVVLKLSAKFVRLDKHENLPRYAFEFTRMKPGDVDMISKYVTKEQVEQLKMHSKLK